MQIFSTKHDSNGGGSSSSSSLSLHRVGFDDPTIVEPSNNSE
jgi:hypothetical protein